MQYGFLDVALTPSVKAAQRSMGADHIWPRVTGRQSNRFTLSEKEFIATRDTFYMATVSETGWPYVQHRGGSPGFLKVLDDQSLAFADFLGNRQYISLGNINANDRICMILMDYPNRLRLKIYAHAEVHSLDLDPVLRDRILDRAYEAKPERIFRLKLQAYDWNCPQHITQRFTNEEIAGAMKPMREKLKRLESENAELHARLALLEGP